MSPKKIIFRADGNAKTGLGHLYRLFALVEIYRSQYGFIFLTRASSDRSVIPGNYNLQLIPDGIQIDEEIHWIAKNYPYNQYAILLDGYQFSSSYQKQLKEANFFVAYIDDLASEHMHADIVINHSIAASVSDYSAEAYTQFALGANYAMVRPAFIEKSKNKRKINSIRNTFICFGGSDIHDLTYKCAKGVANINEMEQIHVVVGSSYQHQRVFELRDHYRDRIFIHKNLSEEELIKVMEKCQLAVIPTSTISYEANCVKMLILGGYYVDNQERIYQGFKSKNVLFEGGDYTIYDASLFEIKVREIMSKSIEDYMVKLDNQHRLFDGKQKQRFLNLMEGTLC